MIKGIVLPLSLAFPLGNKGGENKWVIRLRVMNPTSKLRCKGITKLHQQSASTRLKPRNLSGGGLLSGMIEFGRMLLQ